MSRHRLSRALLAIALLTVAWTLFIALTGGFFVELGPLRISSRNYQSTIWMSLISALALSAVSLLPDHTRVTGVAGARKTAADALRWPGAAPIVRSAVVVALVVGYFAFVFRFSERRFLQVGLGDWVDPYFINYLLEHWYQSIRGLSDPISPPMYFPARGTLGYSVGLVLFVPFYTIARLVLEPFAAYTAALFVALVSGSLTLYLVCRKFVGLGFLESVLVTVFFFSSENVVNGGTGVWSQTASVFVIPSVLAIALTSVWMEEGSRMQILAWVSGLLSALLFTQEFYTAQFTLFMAMVFLPPLTRLADGDSTQTRLAAIWQRHGAWIRAFALGGFVGGLVFLAIYLRSYLEHSAFPEEDLVSKLTVRDPSAWSSPLDVIRSLDSYISMRTFLLVCVLASLACVPRIRMDRTARVLALWLLAVSALVALLPLRFNDFSVWKIFFAPLPGFSAIRDPRRIIPVYELAAVLIVAVVLARLPWRAPVRIGVSVALFVLLVTHRNREVFDFLRPVETFERWVAAPIAIDPSCRSFFIKGASAQYMARSNHMWTLYNIDAMFVSLQHGLPTLNGYSAWWPQGWLLANPQEDTYLERVNGWINQRELRDVCAFDIDARRMTPYHASSR